MELKEYIKKARELEISCYKQQCYLQELRGALGKEENPMFYREEYPEESRVDDVIPTLGCGSCIWGPVVGAVIGAISGSASFFKAVGIGAAIGFGVGLIVLLVLYLIKAMDQNRLNNKARNANVKIQHANRRISEHADKRAAIIREEIARAETAYNETYDTLQRYYEKDIIYGKYRNLIPICMFYEYLVSGRCTQLTGHEGAYNLYETEARMQIIIINLNKIIEKLDAIETNQYMLAEAIKETQDETRRLSGIVQEQTQALCSINDNIEVSNRYARINAANTSYLSWLASSGDL